MNRLAPVFVLAFAALAVADTLTLRNGDRVTGSWVGVDAEKVRFVVNDQIETYPRAEVSEVIFGSPVASPASPAVSAPATANAPGPEPEWEGAVYFREASGSLTPLDRRVATPAAGPPGTPRSSTNFYNIDGPKSPVRLRRDNRMVFVVRLTNGADPRHYGLYALESKKGDRVTKLDIRTRRVQAIPLEVSRVSANSYSLTPASDLPPGEYAFSPDTSNDTYSFGID